MHKYKCACNYKKYIIADIYKSSLYVNIYNLNNYKPISIFDIIATTFPLPFSLQLLRPPLPTTPTFT